MTIYYGQKRFYARSLSDSTDLVTLQRNQNYGNIGPLKKDYYDPDDAYIFPAKVADRLLDTATQVTGQFGYDFYFDASGQATIGSRNNPQSWEYFSTNDDTVPPQKTSPSAVGGRYYRNTVGTGAPSWSKTITAHCSRIDLFVGLGYELDEDGNRGLNGGVFLVQIAQRDSLGGWANLVDQEQEFDTYSDVLEDAFFYDDVVRPDGTNGSVFTVLELPFAEYQITITPVGPSSFDSEETAVVRLNGAAIFERNPNKPAYPRPLSTEENLLELSPTSNEKDLRNQIIVVGQRKATVTDSTKFFEAGINNPFTEFFLSVAADPQSLYDPEAANFVGGKRVAVIVDEKVTDSDFARWLARTALYRYNAPKLDASVRHTAIPVVELRDPLELTDARDGLFPFTVWVKGYQERWGIDDSEVTLELTSYQELPSYTPREDLDVDALFESSPAYRIRAQYLNLFGQQVTNPKLPAIFPEAVREIIPIKDGNSITLPPGSYADDAFLVRNTTTGTKAALELLTSKNNPDKNILINTPYRHFWNVDSDGRTLLFDFQEGDGTEGVYDKESYQFPVDWSVSYERFNRLTTILSANEPDYSSGMTHDPTGGRDGSECWRVLDDSDELLAFRQYYGNDLGGLYGSQVHVFRPSVCGRIKTLGVAFSLNMNNVTLTSNYRILSLFGANVFPTLTETFSVRVNAIGSAVPQTDFIPLQGDVTIEITPTRHVVLTIPFVGSFTSSTTLSADGWSDHLEVQAFAHPSRGWVTIRQTTLPGGTSTVILHQENINTQGIDIVANDTTIADRKYPFIGIRIGQKLVGDPANGTGICFGDVICYNAESMPTGSYLGPAQIGVLRPTANGTYQDGQAIPPYFGGTHALWENVAELGYFDPGGPTTVQPGVCDNDVTYNVFTQPGETEEDDPINIAGASQSYLLNDPGSITGILSVRPFYLAGVESTPWTSGDPVPTTDVSNINRLFIIAGDILTESEDFSLGNWQYAQNERTTLISDTVYSRLALGDGGVNWAFRWGMDVDPRTKQPWTAEAVAELEVGWKQISAATHVRLSSIGLRYVYNVNSFTVGAAPEAVHDNIFYDPYTSESGIGNLVNLRYDALLSGFYRVSLWAVSPNGEFDFPVAFLTKPEAAASDENAHWVYAEAGTRQELTWDGTDSLGLWNRYQSRELAKTLEGSFGDQPLGVGAGFYVWNDQSVSPLTLIGDDVPENYDEDNRPFFTKGRYARFYVKIEAKSDRMLRKGTGRSLYTIDSHKDLKVLSTPFYVFTHTGEPTQCRIRVEDWQVDAVETATTHDWSETTTEDRWHSTISNTDTTSLGEAQIRNGKPVRVTFEPIPRRGVLFRDEIGDPDPTKISVQLIRDVHLKLNVFDQFWTFYGTPWTSDQLHSKNQAQHNSYNKDSKRVTSRMYTDDGNTIELSSGNWISGNDLISTEWIFQPEFFEKDFGAGTPEAIRYGDYEQLYSLPGFDTKKGGGTARADKSFILLAFMNYLFYLSAHILDRSGRRQYCLNTNFIDKSKIVSPDWLDATIETKPEYAVSYERFDAERYLARTVICRQWVEPRWISPPYMTGSPVDQYHPGTGGMEPQNTVYGSNQWVQTKVKNFYPLTTPLLTGVEDLWMTAYMTGGTHANADFWQAWTHIDSRSPRTIEEHDTHYRLTSFGAWTFDRYGHTDLFKPSPCRDFMPYWRAPGMPDWGASDVSFMEDGIKIGKNTIGTEELTIPGLGVNILEIPASFNQTLFRDMAAQNNWFGYAFADNYHPREINWRGARLEIDVIAWAHGEDKKQDMANVYDYVRQDTLNRFDMFRGVFSRAPIAKRDDYSRTPGSSGYWRIEAHGDAGVAPVKPSGLYMLNVGNYTDYLVGPPTAKQWQDSNTTLNLTHDCNNMFDMRFRHEYVWYSSRYFPIHENGGAKYWDFKGLASSNDIGPKTPELYDEGAWIGHKDDIEQEAWEADPFLRWAELFGLYDNIRKADPQFANSAYTGTIVANGFAAIPSADSTVVRLPFLCGGYKVPNIESDSFASTGYAEAIVPIMGKPSFMRRANFFSDVYSNHRLRLAVGPRTPESRDLIMNLSLPTGLSK